MNSMWIVGLGLVLIIVVWVIALNVDARFFRGRYLIKDKITPTELRDRLLKVMAQKTTPIADWDGETQTWFFDYFVNVPLMYNHLEEIRKPIVVSIKETESQKNIFLDSKTVRLVESAIRALG